MTFIFHDWLRTNDSLELNHSTDGFLQHKIKRGRIAINQTEQEDILTPATHSKYWNMKFTIAIIFITILVADNTKFAGASLRGGAQTQ